MPGRSPLRFQGGARRRSERGWLVADVVLLVVFAFTFGVVISWVRFRTAQLPAVSGTEDVGLGRLLVTGLLWTGLMIVAFFILAVVAYLLAGRHWGDRRAEWHRVIVRRGVRRARRGQGQVSRQRAPAGETAVRILAGVNTLVLSGVFTAVVVTLVQRLVIDKVWVSVPLGVVLFAGLYVLLTNVGPLRAGAGVHAGIWTVVALIAALFATLPLGVLVLIGVVISTLGRKVARTELPRRPSEFIRSPLPWMLAVAYAAVGVAYFAVPPVPFGRVTISTAAGTQVGGYLSSSGSGTYFVSCQGLATATSYEPRIAFVSAHALVQSRRGGPTFYVDSGDRPSIATLIMRRLGVSIRLPVPLGTGLRATQPTCASTGPSSVSPGHADPSLGAGVLAGPAPAGGRAVDGDPPMRPTSSPVAALALRLQPTLEVSDADLDWPVSVAALLADRGSGGAVPCLHQTRAPTVVCPATLADLSRNEGSAADYLQYPTPQARSSSPSPLNGEPQVELAPFEAGQHAPDRTLRQWLIDPGALDPWATAQIYFVDGGIVRSGFPGWPVINPQVPSGLLVLEYWFYYQYNYFPTVFDAHLMNAAPVGGDLVNTDLHQGDWEHVDVLVDPVTHQPLWLYLARHSNEGRFMRWGTFPLDGTHPIIQAAFGGHPSYTTCGDHQRNTPVPLSDWVACGYDRFAFRAQTTPLVDLRATKWGCWKGHFGYAGPGTISSTNENFLDQARTKYYLVAGPPSPLRQAENSQLGLCPG